MREKRTGYVVFCVTTLIALAGCSDSAARRAARTPAASQGAEGTPEPAPATLERASARPGAPTSSLVDAQIVRVADVLDSGEIAQARLAASRARDPRVQAFAQRMIRQHSENLEHSTLWQHRSGVTSEQSAASAQLEAHAKLTLHTLDDMDASMFDATYIQNQVDEHRRALDLLDRQLIPNAIHPELKIHLRLRRNVVANHLADVQELHASLRNQN
jgi:putative membrane protein